MFEFIHRSEMHVESIRNGSIVKVELHENATTAFITSKELAMRWDTTPQSLNMMRHRGGGPIFTKIGGAVRYNLADVEAYENAQRFKRTDTQA